MKKILALLLLGVTAVAHANSWETTAMSSDETLQLEQKDLMIGHMLYRQGDNIPLTIRVNHDNGTTLQAVEVDCKAKSVKAISQAYIYRGDQLVGGMMRSDNTPFAKPVFLQVVMKQVCN